MFQAPGTRRPPSLLLLPFGPPGLRLMLDWHSKIDFSISDDRDRWAVGLEVGVERATFTTRSSFCYCLFLSLSRIRGAIGASTNSFNMSYSDRNKHLVIFPSTKLGHWGVYWLGQGFWFHFLARFTIHSSKLRQCLNKRFPYLVGSR